MHLIWFLPVGLIILDFMVVEADFPVNWILYILLVNLFHCC